MVGQVWDDDPFVICVSYPIRAEAWVPNSPRRRMPRSSLCLTKFAIWTVTLPAVPQDRGPTRSTLCLGNHPVILRIVQAIVYKYIFFDILI